MTLLKRAMQGAIKLMSNMRARAPRAAVLFTACIYLFIYEQTLSLSLSLSLWQFIIYIIKLLYIIYGKETTCRGAAAGAADARSCCDV